MLNVLDLFSGIGGFSLGFERAGMNTVAFCEYDPHARKILKKHWPEVPIHEDIRQLNGEKYYGIDVLCGGFPCQPYSRSGKQLGENDHRDLWPEMRRVIEESRPRWIVCENSSNVLNMAFGKIRSDLEAIGYEVGEPLCIPACAINADHRRERAWICANSKNIGLQGIGEKEISRIAGLQIELTGIFESKRSRSSISKPGMLRSYNGIPCGVDRIKRLGNAVVPQIPEAIGRIIISIENELIKLHNQSGSGTVQPALHSINF